ncbi:fimbrillin family protein [Phocaeicola sp.]
MKTKYLALTALALTLTACNNNDETDNKVNGEPVEARFFGEINGATHRAAGTAWTTGDAIGITETSGNTYTNIKYTYAGGSNALFTAATTANTIYYQNDDEITFTAYYPFGGTETTAPADVTATLTADMQDATNKSVDSKFTPQSQIDFLYGTGKGQRTTNDGKVEFKFEHQMSKLVLNFIAGNEVSLDDLSQYKLDGLEMAGTFSPNNGTAAASTTETPKTLTIQKTGGSFSGNVSSLILFPQTATSATLTVTVSGNTYAATLSLPTKTATGATGNGLESGKSYTYNVTVGSKKMTVSKADISNWTDGTTTGGENVDAVPGA